MELQDAGEVIAERALSVESGHTGGEDAFQALQLALRIIPVELHQVYQKAVGGRIYLVGAGRRRGIS